METLPDGYIVHNVTGIRVQIVSRMDGKGYDVSKRECRRNDAEFQTNCALCIIVGPYAVKTGQKVYFNDSSLVLGSVGGKDQASMSSKRIPEVGLRFYLDYVDPMLQLGTFGLQDAITETSVVAATALFAGDPTVDPPLRFGHGSGDGVRVVRFPDNRLGCSEYSEILLDNEAVVVDRGDCTFLEKLVFAQRAGASGVVVLGTEEQHINPSADKEEVEAAGPQLDDVAVVVLRRSDADEVSQMLDSAQRYGLGTVKLVVEPWRGPADGGDVSREKRQPQEQEQRPTPTADPARILYLNNHPLLNTRLIV